MIDLHLIKYTVENYIFGSAPKAMQIKNFTIEYMLPYKYSSVNMHYIDICDIICENDAGVNVYVTKGLLFHQSST